MRFLHSLLLALSVVSPVALAQEAPASDTPKVKHEYQSDVARLRKIVIESLYSHREVFLRELISNANDAIEKLRLTSLTDKTVYDGNSPLNITIQAFKAEDDSPAKLVISDTGIGMTPDELTRNLGTLAKSGTSEFLKQAETGDKSSGANNLIGAFGLGFYSSFLVADRVYVASVPPPSAANPNPKQHVFSSAADEPAFEVYQDPRGNTLERGTEITLVLKKDATKYISEETIKNLVAKHSAFATNFPIYLMTESEHEIDVVDDTAATSEEKVDADDEEAIVEDVKEEKAPATKKEKIIINEWLHLNGQPPLWAREPKDVTDEEYKAFYKATFKDAEDPLAWYHFGAEAGSVSFKSILFLPKTIPEEFYQSAKVSEHDVRLMVKRVFITKDLGEHALPKWISWLRAVIDADDLPLNVSRETLQNTKFTRQIKNILVKRFIQLLEKTKESDRPKFLEIMAQYNGIAKLGAIESPDDKKVRQKLSALSLWNSNQRENLTLDEYAAERKEGQDQIFFLANVGHSKDHLKGSVFVEKLDKRGYEVLLMNEAMDEVLVNNLRTWENMVIQDVSKKGLKYGDEDPEAEKKDLEEHKELYKPLIEFVNKKVKGIVKDVVITNRLVTSPCAIVVDLYGYSANMEKLLASHGAKTNPMTEYARTQRVLEINPRSPLIEGLLKRIKSLPDAEAGEDRDADAEQEIEEVVSILIDGALVRSGFEVPDTNVFFERVDRALRRSLGVSENAKADDTVEPAPPVATEPLEPNPEAILEAEEFGEWSDMKKKILDPELQKTFGSVDSDMPPPGARLKKDVNGWAMYKGDEDKEAEEIAREVGGTVVDGDINLEDLVHDEL